MNARAPAATALVVLKPDELAALVKAAVAEALAEHDRDRTPEQLTLSGAEMAKRLGISRSTMHELRTRDGCPAVKLGDHYRYELDRVMAWVRERQANEDRTA